MTWHVNRMREYAYVPSFTCIEHTNVYIITNSTLYIDSYATISMFVKVRLGFVTCPSIVYYNKILVINNRLDGSWY